MWKFGEKLCIYGNTLQKKLSNYKKLKAKVKIILLRLYKSLKKV